MRQTIGSSSSFLLQILIALVLLANLASAFYVPYAEDYFMMNNPIMEKRTLGPYGGPRHEKREFSADDLSLRFGKRSGRLAFNPEDLHLRFGK
ncbi:unnamed protein product, partial [Mesorhabditis belari]|uniref:Uncharacterized protein n=1 Tax=Mesorhabditis belari TaxID=2138241 RepID=A0AAF3J5S8_9BILA